VIRVDKIIKVIAVVAIALVSLFLLFLSLDTLFPLDTKRVFKPKSTLIYDKDQRLLTIHLSEDGFLRIPLDYKDINSDIKDTLLSYEDRYFYSHFGINPISIVRALWFNLRNSRRIGASTITMQLARMMHHKPRTITNKLIEIFMALQLEYRYSKDEILTIYLNNAPYGGNIEGFASASFAYFNLPTSSLSLAQIAYLVSIPKNPNQNRPRYKKRVERLKRRVLKKLYTDETIDTQRYNRAKEEIIYPQKRDLPRYTPHLSNKIAEDKRYRGVSITTTIDFELQNRVESLLKDRVSQVKRFNINNASAIVIDNKTMSILSYVGSSDFYDKAHGGEIDGISSLFSPGSTLKPFIYAKALEKGLITPLKKLYDLPLNISGYSPLNYSKYFLGEVTASEALAYSLNIPAVELDQLLEDESLYYTLKRADISSITQNKEYYGSALALGGCGITLRDLAELFASFANGGVYAKSHFIKDRPKAYTTPIMTKESSYLISQILANAPRKHFNSSWEYMSDIPKVAFKTGTSAHARDMLSVGYTPQYTVAVWYGNFTNKKSKKPDDSDIHITGLEIASPTLESIFKYLQPKEWFNRPKNIIKKSICQDIIKIGKCHSKVEDDTIRGVKLRQPCSILRAEVLNNMIKTHTIESIDSLKSNRCYDIWRAYKPTITTPIDNKKYIQNRLLPQHLKKIPLECYSYESNSTIYWLIDNNTPSEGKSGEKKYIYLNSGKHQISCLDQGAKMKSIEIEMQEL